MLLSFFFYQNLFLHGLHKFSLLANELDSKGNLKKESLPDMNKIIGKDGWFRGKSDEF